MHRANASDRPKIRYDEDEAQDIHDEVLSQAITDIGLHIHKVEVTTVGEIRRSFPHYTDLVWDVLRVLKLDGLANYDEHAPAPTKVTNKPMRMAIPLHWNNSALYAKTSGGNKRSVPDSSSYQMSRDRITA